MFSAIFKTFVIRSTLEGKNFAERLSIPLKSERLKPFDHRVCGHHDIDIAQNELDIHWN